MSTRINAGGVDAGTANLVLPAATAGNLLVLVMGHRSDLATPTVSSPTGMQVVSTEQFQTDASDRRGVTVWAKIADGGETTYTGNFAGSTPAKIAMEFSITGTIIEVGSNVGSSAGATVTQNVPTEPSATPDQVAIMATTARNNSSLSYDGFLGGVGKGLGVSTSELMMAWTDDPFGIAGGDVTLTMSGSHLWSSVVSTWSEDLTWVLSGNVTSDGSPVSGAQVIVAKGTGAGFDTPTVEVATTDVNGDYSVDMEPGQVGHAMVAYDDTVTLYTAEGRPFIEDA